MLNTTKTQCKKRGERRREKNADTTLSAATAAMAHTHTLSHEKTQLSAWVINTTQQATYAANFALEPLVVFVHRSLNLNRIGPI